MAMPSTSRRPSPLTPTATVTATGTMRPASRTFTLADLRVGGVEPKAGPVALDGEAEEVAHPPVDLGPLEQSSHDLVGVRGQGDDGIELGAAVGERGVEVVDLRERTRVPVEQEATVAVGLSEPLGHDRAAIRVGLRQ